MFILAFTRYTNLSCAMVSIKQCVNTILLFSANEVALGVTTINSKLEVRGLFHSHLLPLQTLQILHLTPKSTLTQNWLKTNFLANRQGTKRWQKQQIQQQLWSLNTIRYVSNGFGGFCWVFFLLWKKNHTASRTLSCRYVHGFELFVRTFNTGLEDILMIFYKGETGKHALKIICLQFFLIFLSGRLSRFLLQKFYKCYAD